MASNQSRRRRSLASSTAIYRCTGFGDCNMTFSRSEHLARHVRKHTGERPFRCHCGRSFSRLDNVRQHAGTVHAESPTKNAATMLELVQLHNSLSAQSAQAQMDMGMVIKDPDSANAPPKKRRTKQVSDASSKQQIKPEANYNILLDESPQPATHIQTTSAPRAALYQPDYAYSQPMYDSSSMVHHQPIYTSLNDPTSHYSQPPREKYRPPPLNTASHTRYYTPHTIPYNTDSPVTPVGDASRITLPPISEILPHTSEDQISLALKKQPYYMQSGVDQLPSPMISSTVGFPGSHVYDDGMGSMASHPPIMTQSIHPGYYDSVYEDQQAYSAPPTSECLVPKQNSNYSDTETIFSPYSGYSAPPAYLKTYHTPASSYGTVTPLDDLSSSRYDQSHIPMDHRQMYPSPDRTPATWGSMTTDDVEAKPTVTTNGYPVQHSLRGRLMDCVIDGSQEANVYDYSGFSRSKRARPNEDVNSWSPKRYSPIEQR